jgi:hypothetical protein
MGIGHAVAAAVVTFGAVTTAQTVDLPALLASGKLRVVNREVTRLTEAGRAGVHLSAAANNGIAWIEGSEFGEGTITVDVRGKDVLQQSFLGLAFHRKDDNTYEGVYLRPFNFRATDPARHQHAVQYMSLPDFDWPKLRETSPEEFENPVDASVSPTDWVTLRIVVQAQKLQIFVGSADTPALEVRKLGTLTSGQVGLWVGHNSDGDFANLRMAK